MESERIIFQSLPALPNRHEWQIDRRYRIQNFLYLLYQFLEDHSEFHRDGDDEWHQLLRMVDIAFSLWRSAFLTNVAQSRKAIHDDVKEFVQKLVETNAISFADDYKLCELTVIYYNNNARYRLERMFEHSPKLVQVPSLIEVALMRSAKDLAGRNQTDLWDKYYLALIDCYRFFMENWRANVRPGRKPPEANARKAAPKIGDGSKSQRPRRDRRLSRRRQSAQGHARRTGS